MTSTEQLEDYILENFIDLDLDVPEDLKEKYIKLKKILEDNRWYFYGAPSGAPLIL